MTKKNITLSISKKLLAQVEKNVEGNNRSRKLCECIRIGYEKITSE